MSQNEGKFQSKSRKFGGGGKGKGRPGGKGFGKRFEGDRGGFKGGKRFEGRGGKGGGFKGGGFKGRDERGGGDKPFRKREWNSEGGGDRPFKKKFHDRGEGGGFRNREERGDRPFKKKFHDRGEGGGFRNREERGDRPFKKKFHDRGEGGGFRDRDGGGDRPFKKKFHDRGEGGGFRDRDGGGDRPFKKKFHDRGDDKFRGRGEGGGFKKNFRDRDRDERPRGDRHKPYKRFEDKRRKFEDKDDEGFGSFETEVAEIVEVSPFEPREASSETRQKLKSDRQSFGAPSSAYLYGLHAVRAALQNPKRQLQRLLVTENGFESIREAYEAAQNAGITVPEPIYVDSADLERLLPRDAVHQGVLLDAQPPEEVFLADVLNAAPEHAKIVVLDQVTDPHNVGAIIRSAAAFGAIAVVVQKLHAPDITGTLAKSASGAVEHVPMVREVNLTRALEQMKEAGFFCIGLAEEGKDTLPALSPSGRTAIVLGAEGEGLRRLVSETCDALAKLPTAGPISSLNVSNAAAVALYELSRGE